MKKVVGLGACVFDTLITVDGYPREDTKQKATGVFTSGGGPVGNALVILSKLDVKSQVLGAFADDAAGKFLLRDFTEYGVDVSQAKTVCGKTSFTSYILLSETGSRTCVFDRGNVPDDPANVNAAAIDSADILHLDGNYLQSAMYAAKYAHTKGVLVSLDAGGLYEGIEQLLPLVDILIPSAEFATGFTGKNTVEDAVQTLYARFAPQVLVVTDGANGGCYRTEDGKIVSYESIPVKAVDTNGAGDTFHGAFLAAHLQGKTVQECCAYAAKVAAYKCAHKGLRTLSFAQDEIEKIREKI